jgi:hypothetical protein
MGERDDLSVIMKMPMNAHPGFMLFVKAAADDLKTR